MTKMIEPIEIKEFISNLLDQIEQGVNIEERDIKDSIEIAVSIDSATKAEGGIKYIVRGEVGKNTQSVASVKFNVYPKQSMKSVREENEIKRLNRENDDKWQI